MRNEKPRGDRSPCARPLNKERRVVSESDTRGCQCQHCIIPLQMKATRTLKPLS